MVDLVQWWYLRGWGVFANGLKTKLSDTADFFSVGQLLKTLFKPYRQIGAGAEAGPGESRISVFFDKLISRLVGMVTRLMLIIFGGIAMLMEVILGGVMLVIWPVVPALPIVGIAMTVMGVTL